MTGEKPDFSGTWRFNPGRSRLEISPPEETTITIVHNEPAFRMVRTHVMQGRTDTFTMEVTTDGKDVLLARDRMTIHARVYWEGLILVFDSTLEMEGTNVMNVVRYQLEPGGTTLIARESLRGERRSYDNVWFLDKATG